MSFRVLAIAVIAVLAILAAVEPVMVRASGPSAPQPFPSDLEQRGKELRGALEMANRNLDSFARHGPGRDVTNVVTPFIPVGTSFMDAETILRNAGFTIMPHPDLNSPSNPNKPMDWYAVLAEISPFAQRLASRTDLYVTLLPKSPGDYTTVSKVAATIFVSLP